MLAEGTAFCWPLFDPVVMVVDERSLTPPGA
jgi:hypothetical protein